MKKLLLFSLLLMYIKMVAFDSSQEFLGIYSQKIDAPIFTILLPIDVNFPQGQRTNLQIDIPFECIPIQDPTENPLVVYFPLGQTLNNWSSAITTHVLTRIKMSSPEMAGYLKAAILKNAKAPSIIEEKSETKDGIASSHLIMAYEDSDRTEIMLASYFSGRSDCSGFQYTMALGQEDTREDVLKKLREFKNKNTRLHKS